MKKSLFTDEQIPFASRQAKSGPLLNFFLTIRRVTKQCDEIAGRGQSDFNVTGGNPVIVDAMPLRNFSTIYNSKVPN